MASPETAFEDSLADYQKQQKSYHDLREQVKKEFQEQKDQGSIPEDTEIQTWLTQEHKDFSFQSSNLKSAASKLQLAARYKYGEDSAEEELEKIGLSKYDFQVQTALPGEDIDTPGGRVTI